MLFLVSTEKTVKVVSSPEFDDTKLVSRLTLNLIIFVRKHKIEGKIYDVYGPYVL